MPIDKDEIAVLAEEIRLYLETHPAAADTLDGIVSWWLPGPRHPHAVESVERALDMLADAGVVEKVTRSDGHVIYRRAHLGRSRAVPPNRRFDA
jgi:hypothetical protein